LEQLCHFFKKAGCNVSTPCLSLGTNISTKAALVYFAPISNQDTTSVSYRQIIID
jgi:hypothetical protein